MPHEPSPLYVLPILSMFVFMPAQGRGWTKTLYLTEPLLALWLTYCLTSTLTYAKPHALAVSVHILHQFNSNWTCCM
jgi:hypothetical protein